jgi:hypothetical protein
LIHGAIYDHESPAALTLALVDDLAAKRVEIDMIRFSGPAFATTGERPGRA